MYQFAHYCSTYWALYLGGEVLRSRELTARIAEFDWEINLHGLLEMPIVEERIQQFVNNAWKMQRLIDRIAGGQTNPHDSQYETAEENVQALVDWFGGEKRALKTLFAPYLAAA